jgi:hypothetical protein
MVCRVHLICRVSHFDLHIPVVDPTFTVCLVYHVSGDGTVTIWSTQGTPRCTGARHVSPLPCARSTAKPYPAAHARSTPYISPDDGILGG